MYLPLLADTSTQVGTSSIAQLLATELRSPTLPNVDEKLGWPSPPRGPPYWERPRPGSYSTRALLWRRTCRTSSHDTATQLRHQGTGGRLNNLGLPAER